MALARIARLFGYDAAQTDSRRRRQPAATLRHEDDHQTPAQRKQIVASARDLDRNFEVGAWAIRKHLDFVSTFTFQARTGSETLDTQLEEFVADWSRPENFDAAARHPLAAFVRLAEARRTVDGDIGLLKLRNGRVQAIEGDRIRDPGWPATGWRHGVKTDQAGKAIAYAIHRRVRPSGFRLDRIVSARFLYLHGYFQRFDQTRGVGLITPALNRLRDLYESFELALAKAKIAQLFALATFRDDTDPLGTVSQQADSEDGSGDFTVDFGRGPFHLDLSREDRAEFLESKSPPAEFRSYSQWMVLVALKALDIPFSFFSEDFTNFYGSRAGLIQYLQSCRSKRESNQRLLDHLTRWRLSLAVLDGEISLPRGVSIERLRFDWVPAGVPWWNPAQEAKGHLMLLGAGLDTPQRICRETGTDFYENIDAIAEAIDYARRRGVDLSFAPQPTGPQYENPQ